MSRCFPYLLALTLGIGSLPSFSQIQKSSPRSLVIESRRNYAKGTFPRAGSWQGLYCRGLDCEIRPARVRIKTTSAVNVLDEKELLDDLKVSGKPLALFPGGGLKEGKVVSWYRSGDPSNESPQLGKLGKLGKWDMPWGPLPLTISWTRAPQGQKRYFVSDGSVRQFLFMIDAEAHYDGDTTPIIHWVGDLDGDGKLDLLLSIPDDNCGFDERLYLSSGVGKGQLLRKAAQLSGGEAACGC
ncbi:hypothetical protein [Niveibacterium terrae]|uniref:hypothetical protein n=1 Tax=Niveibacterium terrae TaxID=3373598 RepID=UPI003A8F7F40